PVVMDYRSGSLLAAEAVAKASADGYTLAIQGAALWIAPLLENTPYDTVRDFTPISQIARQVNILAVHPALPVKSVKELIALAKARPGELNYSSGGTGTVGHLGAELFKSMAGVNIVRIPYNANAQQITALISGEVQMT